MVKATTRDVRAMSTEFLRACALISMTQWDGIEGKGAGFMKHERLIVWTLSYRFQMCGGVDRVLQAGFAGVPFSFPTAVLVLISGLVGFYAGLLPFLFAPIRFSRGAEFFFR